ncbi:MAG: hypothetical protein Fur0022_34030 [Anaerolineales bacterium]
MHAQQCAEKSLKVVLFHLNISFPRTHALEVLLDLLKNHGIKVPQGVDQAYELSGYAVQTRYPEEWDPVEKKEARKALEQTALVLNWVENQIAKS